jgi:hypothetical protein
LYSRRVRLACFALAALAVAACADEPEPTDLTFSRYEHVPLAPGARRVVNLWNDQISLTAMPCGNDSCAVRTDATLTAEGRRRIDEATLEAERLWNPPYTCVECIGAKKWTFLSSGGPVTLMHHEFDAPPVVQPLAWVIDEVVPQLDGCGGGLLVQACATRP